MFLALIIFNFLYFLIPSIIFLLQRKKPSIRARVPALTLTTALGLFLKLIFTYINLVVVTAPGTSVTDKQAQLLFCID